MFPGLESSDIGKRLYLILTLCNHMNLYSRDYWRYSRSHIVLNNPVSLRFIYYMNIINVFGGDPNTFGFLILELIGFYTSLKL
jgi:hypothetical protein